MRGVPRVITLAFTAVSASAFASHRSATRFGGGVLHFLQPNIAFCGIHWSSNSISNSSNRLSTGSTSLDMSAADFAKQEIEANKVVVFSKSFCPYCTSTKALFKNLGVDAKVYELDEMDDGPAIQDALLAMTGQRTVPNVFINKKHVGGNDSVQAANKTGKLREMLGI